MKIVWIVDSSGWLWTCHPNGSRDPAKEKLGEVRCASGVWTATAGDQVLGSSKHLEKAVKLVEKHVTGSHVETWE